MHGTGHGSRRGALLTTVAAVVAAATATDVAATADAADAVPPTGDGPTTENSGMSVPILSTMVMVFFFPKAANAGTVGSKPEPDPTI